MHYFKRNIGDYHKKAGRLSMLEHGAYTLLIDSCYDRERFPTLEDAIEWTWARTEEEIAAVKFVLGKFFDLVDGKYIQTRIQEELDNYHANSKINKQIAIKREEKKKADKARTVHEPSTLEHEPPPNQEPRTINHKPITKYTPPIPEELLNEWKIIRKKKKSGDITERVWKGIERESKLSGITAEKAIEICCEKGWASFDASWYSRNPSKQDSLKRTGDLLTGRTRDEEHLTIDMD